MAKIHWWVAILPLLITRVGIAHVELKEIDGRWTLLREGEPYRINGAAGPWRLKQLAERGGNSVRNWGVGPDTRHMLDEAKANGISVTLCISIPRAGKEFDWAAPDFNKAQADRIRAAVEAHREHPALLMWSLGNEAENENPEYWRFIERMAQLVKQLDPNHPVMTIVAEIGGDKAKAARTLAPSLDLLGINSYAGLPSLPDRLTKQAWERPYVITEFGPRGQWEVRKTDFGSPIEQTSTEKSRFVARSFEGVINVDPRCIGSYIFIWGQKQESTHTWYGLFTESGKPLETIDIAQRYWTGAFPADRGPQVVALQSQASERRVRAGDRFTASVEANDPEGSPLKFQWDLRGDRGGKNQMGKAEALEQSLFALIEQDGTASCSFIAPSEPGRYRLFVEIEDSAGKCATANFPFYVE